MVIMNDHEVDVLVYENGKDITEEWVEANLEGYDVNGIWKYPDDRSVFYIETYLFLWWEDDEDHRDFEIK